MIGIGVNDMDFGEKIKQLRLSRGMTLEQVGNIVGVGKSTVRKWENGDIKNMGRDKIEPHSSMNCLFTGLFATSVSSMIAV